MSDYDPWAGFDQAPDSSDDEGWPFVDVAALLADDLPEPPRPTVALRQDGVGAFYAGRVNSLVGDPECGKTTLARAAAAEVLSSGGRVLIIDADHNGAALLLRGLLNFGATAAQLSDPGRFLLAEPDAQFDLLDVIDHAKAWRPTLAVVDSIGEVVPMLGLSSNSPDDYTRAHRMVLTPLARAGACVIGIDHLAKSEDSRRRGPGGTLAKLRAASGVTYRMRLREPFAPGRGGSAGLSVLKDRPGGIRAHSPASPSREQPAGIFVVEPSFGGERWHITTPSLSDEPRVGVDDIAELDGLEPPPRSVDDVKSRLRWGGTRATNALREWRAIRGES